MTDKYDYSNSFNLRASTFTAPVTGVYDLGAFMNFILPTDQIYNINEAYLKIMISRGGNLISIQSPYATIYNTPYDSEATVSFATNVKLLSGDVVWFRGFQINGADESLFLWDGSFYGHLVFAE